MPKPETVPREKLPHIELPRVDQRLCTAVVVLVDTSGSMKQSVRDVHGAQRPKAAVAHDALRHIVQYTEQWKKAHPDRALSLGLYSFADSSREVLAPQEFDAAAAEAAIGRIPRPGGSTAIGRALEEGFRALYKSGCVRKYIICVTDGENRTGPSPALVAKQLHEQTHGEVEMHFVAFDTSSGKFGFLPAFNGFVVEAADGEQLQARLSAIYEQRILAEAMPAESE